jgi:hypothetical protein
MRFNGTVANRPLDLRRLGASLLIAGALALIIYGFASAETGDQAVEINDPAIERVIPAPGSLVLRQSQVGADLAPGYRGVLVIDGNELPTEDVQTAGGNPNAGPISGAQFDPALNTVLYLPREGAVLPDFAPGEHHITVVYWKMDETRDQARQFDWTFKVS